jgi:hypothetical protein
MKWAPPWLVALPGRAGLLVLGLLVLAGVGGWILGLRVGRRGSR